MRTEPDVSGAPPSATAGAPQVLTRGGLLPAQPEIAPTPPPAQPIVPAPRRRRGHRLARFLRGIILVLAGLVGLYALLVGVIAPPIARSVAQRKLTAALERRVTIERITVNPFTLVVTVRGFALHDPDGSPFAGFEELRVNLEAISLYRGGLIVHDATLVRPVLRLVRDRPSHYNFSDLAARAMAPNPAGEASAPTRYSINNIRIFDGSVDFVDRPKQTTHTIRGLLVAVPFVSNLPYDAEDYVLPALSANIDGTVLNLGGRAKPFSPDRATDVDLDVRELSLARYFDYVPVPLGFTLASATLDAALSVQLRKPADEPPRVALAGRLAVKDVVAGDLKGRPLVRFARLAIEIAPSEPLAGRMSLASVQLERPLVWARRDAAGRFNLADLVPAPAAKAPAAKAPAAKAPAPAEKRAPFLLTVDSAQVADGTIHFTDAPAGGPFAATFSDVELTARHFSTARDAVTALELKLRSDAGERLEDRGQLTVSPLAARGHLALTRVPLQRYAPYYAPLLFVDVDAGSLALAADYDVRPAGPAVAIRNGELSLDGLKAHRRSERQPLIAVATLAVHRIDADLTARTLQLGEVATSGGRLTVLRGADGVVNLSTLVPPAGPPPPTTAAPWTLGVARAGIQSWVVRFEDRKPDPEEPVRITTTLQSVSISDWSSVRGTRTRFDLRARINAGGALTASGSLVADPLSAAVRLDGKTIDLVPLVPYFADRANLVLTRGKVSFGGKLALATTRQGLSARYQGHLLVDRLATVDVDDSDPLLSWDTLYLAGIDARSAPPAIDVGELSLTGFYARLAVDEQARLNVKGLVPAPAQPAPPGPPVPVRVAKVTLQAGTIDYSDDYVQPSFATSLTEVGGRVTGLSSSPDTTADVDLRGKLEGVAPLEITGKLNPLAKELSLDLAVMFRDIELGPLSPYAGKYAGYNIARGKLNLELKYNVQHRQLDASNKVFIDQLKLGDRVQSKHATKLPVKLIVFVLRDRNGEIRVDLPISGSLDDPKFRLGRIILQAVLNVLTKAATQPFAMLGALFGRGPELAYVEFAPGRAELDKAAADKLRVVAKVLDSRPGLKLEITGHVGMDADREGLRRLLFERKVKSQKLKALTKQHVAVAESVDQIAVAPDEWERYLWAAYGEEKFPKPRNAIGMVKKLPASELEKLMLTHIVVEDEQLRLLAHRRAETARQSLVQAKIGADRIFVLEPKVLAAPPHDKARATRVDFTIR